MSENKKRITWIDAGKGIAIIFLLLGHSIPHCDLFRNWISSWHMPIFFIICGYISSLKYRRALNTEQLIQHVIRRWHNLWIPYILFGCILILFYNFLNYISGQPFDFITRIESLFFMRGIDSLWFIPVYFFAELFFLMICNRKCELSVFIILIVSIVFIRQDNLSWPYDLFYKIIEGLCFVIVGDYFFKLDLEKIIPLPIAVLMLLFCAFGSSFNWDASMNAMRSAPIYLTIATLSSFAILSISSKFEILCNDKGKLLLYYGKNSLIVMCTNNLIIESLRLVDYRLTSNWMMNTGYIGYICFFLIITILEYPMIKLFEGKFK